MISLSLDRTSLSLSAISVTDTDTGSGTRYILQSFSEGRVDHVNQVATSRWVDGGTVTSTRRDLVGLEMVIRVWSTTLPDLLTACDALGVAIGQFGWAMTATVGTGTRTYTCLPGSYAVSLEPQQLRHFTALVTCFIPRQP